MVSNRQKMLSAQLHTGDTHLNFHHALHGRDVHKRLENGLGRIHTLLSFLRLCFLFLMAHGFPCRPWPSQKSLDRILSRPDRRREDVVIDSNVMIESDVTFHKDVTECVCITV